jgi:hypothetical protein
MCALRDIEVRSCDHCCRGYAISITYSDCVSVALAIQREMRICHLCSIRLHNIFLHYLINGKIFGKRC